MTKLLRPSCSPPPAPSSGAFAASPSVRGDQRRPRGRGRALLWYLLFGALHECAHLLAARSVGILSHVVPDDEVGGAAAAFLRAALGRCCVVPAPKREDVAAGTRKADTVRHAGWVFSVALALSVVLATERTRRRRSRGPNRPTDEGDADRGGGADGGRGKVAPSTIPPPPLLDSPCALAAVVTALEAIATDLLGLGVPPSSSRLFASAGGSGAVFFCGNFGMLLLDPHWMMGDDSGRSALDVLERMANVTMMRGAQSGGVVTFIKNKRPPKRDVLIGVRSRSVNAKRTDLSKKIRAKVQRDVFSTLCSPALHSSDLVQTFVGHTRFATTSKATFEGTHPQRWTPPMYRRMYNFNLVDRLSKTPDADSDFPRPVRVENYVTHNGDFDFYELHGRDVELRTIQSWLVRATGAPMPAPVDSAAVAGLVDVLRTQGCFGLSVRYAVCLGLPTSRIDEGAVLPAYRDCERAGSAFEEALDEMLAERRGASAADVGEEGRGREELCARVAAKLRDGERSGWMDPFAAHVDVASASAGDEDGEVVEGADVEDGGRAGLLTFVSVVVDAFFDNDLFHTAKTFLANAKGSFGLCLTTSLDAQRQICLAARGQTLSVAFYPTKGIILYGSEQAAVKAAMGVDFPGAKPDVLEKSHLDVDNDALRLDLDDLGGEICLLDWGGRRFKNPALSAPDRAVAERHRVMNGAVNVYLFKESSTAIKASHLLYHRMTRLTRNQFVRPLQPEADDPVLRDIRDIPKVCRAIQDDWRGTAARHGGVGGGVGGSRSPSMSLNRLTAWNLARCVRRRMEGLAEGTIHRDGGTIDILLTGCEVSLWLAEQFASDLQKAFPKLRIMAVSSNKLLGLFGQEMSIPATGYPMSEKTHRIDDSIVIVVSHSGGTFAPLACSNLLQSTTNDIFVVTSEWDTQIGKQLRQMNNEEDHIKLLFNSRIFTTDVGMRPAEPCSVSVAATHQLLTNVFEHICIVILSDQRFRHASGAVITERDLRVLERCNQDNIAALESIVGFDSRGNALPAEFAREERELREAGDVWSEHILENAKAYIMSFIYIAATVISGYPLGFLIASAAGLAAPWAFYIVRAIDTLIYFYLPQINIIILRLFQRRALRHRMVGRTVVIGDIPWVAQAAEAFLSKIFACSYSIAGLNVLSGNPADHFVHRHTHRVVRGSLVVCGRPDGRLSALSSLESAVCLSVNQASSIQSIDATCESITIGHNPFALPLTARAIFLDRNRPLFLCEHMLEDADLREEGTRHSLPILTQEDNGQAKQPCRSSTEPFRRSSTSRIVSFQDGREGNVKNRQHRLSGLLALGGGQTDTTGIDESRPKLDKKRSSTALMGAYMNLEKEVSSYRHVDDALDRSGRMLQEVVQKAIHERKWQDHVRKLFEVLDVDGDGTLSAEEFVAGYSRLKPALTRDQLIQVFKEADKDDSGNLDLDEFFHIVRLPRMEIVAMLQPSIRDSRGLIQVEASKEEYFGENVMKAAQMGKSISRGATRSQHFSQELYETRIASLQRFVAMTTMFHQMGLRVQSFFPRISFGLLGYRMDRTHSIMRIATTASPVSGADVRERIRALQMLKKVQHSIHVVSVAWLRYKQKKEGKRLKELEEAFRSSRVIQAKEKVETKKIALQKAPRRLSCPGTLDG